MAGNKLGAATCGSSWGGERPLYSSGTSFLRGRQSPCAPGSDTGLLAMLPGLSFPLCKAGLLQAVNEGVMDPPCKVPGTQ